jgi:hypothetical protein
MEQAIHSVPPGGRHVDGKSPIMPLDGARDTTPAEIAAARREVATSAAEKTWTRERRASEWDSLDDEAERDPVGRVWAELARLTCRGPAPRVDAITHALWALHSYAPPPYVEPDDDSDVVPAPPALVERLRYMLTSRTDDPISGRRVRLICVAMDAVRPAGPKPPVPPSIAAAPALSAARDDPVLPDRREHLRQRIEGLRTHDPQFAALWDAYPTTDVDGAGAGAAIAMLARLRDFGFSEKESQRGFRIVRGVPEPYDPSGPLRHFPYTDTGNAERIVARHGQAIGPVAE